MKRTQRGWNSTIRPSTKPIQRKAPVRRARRGQEGRGALAGVSTRKVVKLPRFHAWREAERTWVVVHRAVCEYPGCQRFGEQVHHPFGRTGEPWASSRLVVVHICFPHHERVHRPGPTTSQRVDRDLLREVSVNRLDAWLHEQFSYDTEDRDTDLRARFRYLVRIAIDNDLNPPGFKEETHA